MNYTHFRIGGNLVKPIKFRHPRPMSDNQHLTEPLP